METMNETARRIAEEAILLARHQAKLLRRKAPSLPPPEPRSRRVLHPGAGQGLPGFPKSPEHRAKIRAAMMGNKNHRGPRGRYHRWTREDVEAVNELRRQGFTHRAIATKLGFAMASVSRLFSTGLLPKWLASEDAERPGGKKFVSDQERETIRQMMAAGKRAVDVAKALGRHRNTVYYAMKGDNRARSTRPWGVPLTEKEIKHIRVLHHLGYSANKIAKRIGRSGSSVEKYIRSGEAD